MIEIIQFGDQGILVNFEQKIDPNINDKVIELSEAILAEFSTAIHYMIPAYCSLTVQYDTKLVSFQSLSDHIHLLFKEGKSDRIRKTRQLVIPVCYDPIFGLDIEEFCQTKALGVAELVRRHTAPSYRVYMLGFLPGFVYMGKLPESLHCKRRSTPRLRVPERSVAIAGAQTGIYPSEAPGGWHIIGRTPLALMRPQEEDGFLFKAGDQVQFKPITIEQYHRIEVQVEQGQYALETSYV